MKLILRPHRLTLIILSAILLTGLALVVVIQQWLFIDLPQPGALYQRAAVPSTKIYDRRDTLLYEITDPHQGLHTPLNLTDIPQACREATIATEDASFYTNPGVDVWAIIRAVYINLEGGEVLSGGSTITQQLARNLLLSPQERVQVNLTRKLREAILAWRLARLYSKDEILTLYLNEAYYGNLAYGLEAASRAYFGKHAAELDLAECAMLAGLPQSPANYNPLENPDAAKTRQNTVLDLLVKHGFVPAAEADAARREKLGFAAVPFPIEAPHWVMFVRGQLERQYGLEAIYRQGLQVYTTLDLDMQNAAQRIARYRLADLAERKEGEPLRQVRNAAVVVMDARTGEILTMLGSPNYFDPRIDGAVNATMATRQPGSSIKPLTYAAAFDPGLAAAQGYAPLTAASMMVDERTAFVTKEGQPYVPQNYDRVWRGPVLLRQSLASSFNLVAVKALDYIGLETMIDLARSMGITTFDNKNFGLALTLGGGEVRLVELTAAYGALANSGRRMEPVFIRRITDHQNRLIYETPPDLNPGPPALDARTAYLITDILSDAYARRSGFGAGSPLQLTRPAAAKTGTTQDWRDNWTVGYTPDLITGVWVGNADNEPMRNVSGITGAAPIWHDLMEELHKTRPVRQFSRPDGLVEVTICADNGMLPVSSAEVSGIRLRPEAQPEGCQVLGDACQVTSDKHYVIRNTQYAIPCSHTLTELFIEGTQPKQTDTLRTETQGEAWHQAIALDRRNGLRAGPGCPAEFVAFQNFTLYPAEAQAWAKKQAIPQPPTTYSPFCPNEGGSETPPQLQPSALSPQPLIFTSPDRGSVFRLVPTLPVDKQKIRVSVRPAEGVTPARVSLLVNGQPLADRLEVMWQMSPGEYTFEAVGVDSAGREIRGGPVTVQVVE